MFALRGLEWVYHAQNFLIRASAIARLHACLRGGDLHPRHPPHHSPALCTPPTSHPQPRPVSAEGLARLLRACSRGAPGRRAGVRKRRPHSSGGRCAGEAGGRAGALAEPGDRPRRKRPGIGPTGSAAVGPGARTRRRRETGFERGSARSPRRRVSESTAACDSDGSGPPSQLGSRATLNL